MWKDEIRKEMGYGGPKDVERKILSLDEMGDKMAQFREILSSFEFQKGFDEDAAEDIDEAAKLLDRVIDLISGFGR
jgi:hypothetical protein